MARQSRAASATKPVKQAATAVDAATPDVSIDQLTNEFRDLLDSARQRVVSSFAGKVEDATERLTTYATSGEGSLLRAVTGDRKSAEKGAARRTTLRGIKERISDLSGVGGDSPKVTNIVESIDVGVPVEVAYNQWTQFEDFPTFMKKVERVERQSDESFTWTARVLWSHRTWESTIVEQVPDERIVWRSHGVKGHVDGAVTFHRLAPELTRIMVVLEYYPHGLFERFGDLWHAQGRRARIELRHFQRHVMTQTALHPDEVAGWRGEIRDGRVVDREGSVEDAESESRRRSERRTRSSSRGTRNRKTQSTRSHRAT